MTALCALILADRGELDFDAPVATYWPEFKANGKENVLVRHLMAHTAGLPSWTEPVGPEVLYDWDRACSLLAEQAPWWEPGSASGYHAVTQGYLVGEVVRRVSGRSLGTFFREEVAEPLGADFHIGTGAEHDARCARVIPPPSSGELTAGFDPESMTVKALTNPALDAAQSWSEDWRRAEIPAAGGHGNARSVATAQSVVSHGGEAFGKRLLSEAGVGKIFEEQIVGTDLILGVPLRLGIGYGLNGEQTPLSPNARTCFWGGWGGSIIINDLDARMTIAYVMNRMGEGTLGDTRGFGIVMGAYQGLFS
jgi:CubicO group peptidase (beta-lactamase class C family)